MEILVRIAEQKFKRTKIVETLSDAFEKLLCEHCFRYCKFPAWQDWREEILWSQDVDDVIKSNLENINEVHFRLNKQKDVVGGTVVYDSIIGLATVDVNV